MEIDTGAYTTVIAEYVYREYFARIPLELCAKSLSSVTGELINIVGMCMVGVRLPNVTAEMKLPLYIIKSSKNFCPLLGRVWLDALLPQWRELYKKPSIKSVSEGSNKNLKLDYYVKRYPQLRLNQGNKLNILKQK